MATNQIDTEVLPENEVFNKLATNHQEKTIHGSPHDDFILKMSHPPRSQAFAGLPTEDTRTQVCVEYVNQFLQVPSKYIDGTQIVSRANPTRIAFLQLTGLKVLHIAFVTNLADTQWFQDIANTAINSLYNFKRNWASDVQLYRPTFRSHTSTLNATAFNDTGMVSVNQFNPAFLFQGVVSSLANNDLELFVEYVRIGLDDNRLKSLSKSEDSNWHRFPKFVRDEIKDKLCVENLNIDPNALVQILSLGQVGGNLDFVPDASQILTQSTRSFGSTAKEGTFTVTRLNTETPKFIAASNLTSGTDSGLYECYIGIRRPDNGVSIVALQDQSSTFTTPVLLTDTPWSSDKTCSWTLYEGLSYNAQALPAINQQILIHKYYMGAELQPALQSAFAGMSRLAPKPNFKNMQDLMLMFYDMKDSMPARYNFLGTLINAGASLLKKHAPTVIKHVMGEVGSMSAKDPKLKKDAEKISKLSHMVTQMEIDDVEEEAKVGKKSAKKIVKAEKKVQNLKNRHNSNSKHMLKNYEKTEKKILKKSSKKSK